MKSKNSISVLIPSYNYSKYLGEAIDSLLDQSIEISEIIIVDDGSVDNSLDVAMRYKLKDSKVKVFTHKDNANLGLVKTLQLAFQCAHGEWIAFLDSDDRLHPDALTKRLRLSELTGAEVIVNDIEPIKEKGANLGWFSSYVPRVMDEIK